MRTIVIDPKHLIHVPLISENIGADDFIFTVKGLPAGRIMLRSPLTGRNRWLWALTGPSVSQAGIDPMGEEAAFGVAESVLQIHFKQWLQWALHSKNNVYWHLSEEKKPSAIDPSRFIGSPLVIKAGAENEWGVSADGLPAGRIMLKPLSFGQKRWLWSLTGPAFAQSGLNSWGEAYNLEDAKKALRERFDEWLTWALAADAAVYWYE